MGVADSLSIGTALLAAIACGIVAARLRGRLRLAWLLLGLSGAAWAMVGGATVWIGAGSLPFLTADVRFGAMLVPAVIALAMLPSAPPLAGERLRVALDGAIVAGSLLLVSWALGLGVAYRNVDADLNHRLNALVHPFGDLLLAVMVTFVLYSAIRTARLSRLLLGVGLLVNVGADTVATWSQWPASADNFSSLISWGWAAGFGLLGAAALAEWRTASGQPASRSTFGAAVAVLYLPLLGAATVALLRRAHGEPSDAFLFWEGSVVIALVVARELLTLHTNRGLRRTFEQRLAARTETLSRSESRFRTLVTRSADATVLLDQEGIIHYENDAIERVLGRAPGSSQDRSWLTLVHPEDQGRLQSVLEKSRQAPGIPITVETRVSHGDEGYRQAELTIVNQLADAALASFVLTVHDVTERKAIDEQLAHHALHDNLTRLANRALFRDRLDQSVVRAARRRQQPAVLLLDVDGMKQISKTLGSQAADDVLVAVADRLRECVRAGDTIARLADDEFAVLIEDTENVEAPAHVAERILAELSRVKLGNGLKPLSAGIGLAALPPGLQNADELLRNADTALAEAKAAGAGKIAVYDRSMSTAVASQLELEADLQRAIERKEFLIHYQPMVRLKDGSPTAVEALVRWVHPWRGMLLPGDFILAADKTGAIVSLGRWLMLEASRQVRRWQEELELPTLGLAINLSIRQLSDEGLANDIRHVLRDSGLPPELLMLETMESALLEDLPHSIAVLGNLKDVGASLAIDNCRSDAASLSYIRQLPVDTLKIDRSFVMNLGKQRERDQVRAMIEAGEWLKVAIVAEGIEEPGQASELVAMGCELGQGFHFAKPLAASQMFDYLDKRRHQKAA
ncbi:MAG: EAL domain-containing protein [Chloroflexi bacterium]|nr:MAG: EAL domain-containing protein [Chloroflexota bacterium]